MSSVGVPRALYYYQYFPLLEAFFEHLGAEVVLSAPTTKATLLTGGSRLVTDTCLPVKVFIGHCLSLVEKCDYIFVPSIRCTRYKTYYCSKFLGLPDLVRAAVPECPTILNIHMDIDRGLKDMGRSIHRLRKYFNDKSGDDLKDACSDGLKALSNYRKLMLTEQLTPPQALKRVAGAPQAHPKFTCQSGRKLRVLVIAHPYILYDDFINHHLVNYLHRSGCEVSVPEMLAHEEMGNAVVNTMGRIYWEYEDVLVGAAEVYSRENRDKIDGVIALTVFGCGPDSLMVDIARRRIQAKNIPFINMMLDEHVAEAGLITRLEAFLDMIQRKREKDYASGCTSPR